MKPLFNTSNKLYDEIFNYLKTSTIQDPFRKCDKFLGGPYFVLRRGFDNVFELYMNNEHTIEQDLNFLFNIEDCQKLKRVKDIRVKKGQYAKLNCGRFKDLKLNYYLYKWVKQQGLTLYHDNIYRSGLFYAYNSNKLIAVLQGIRT